MQYSTTVYKFRVEGNLIYTSVVLQRLRSKWLCICWLVYLHESARR